MRDFKDIKVAVAGTGYVGLSIATLLSQHHHVTAVDVCHVTPLQFLLPFGAFKHTHSLGLLLFSVLSAFVAVCCMLKMHYAKPMSTCGACNVPRHTSLDLCGTILEKMTEFSNFTTQK